MLHNFIFSEPFFFFLKTLEIESYTWIVFFLIIFPLLLPDMSVFVLLRTSCDFLSFDKFMCFNIHLHVWPGWWKGVVDKFVVCLLLIIDITIAFILQVFHMMYLFSELLRKQLLDVLILVVFQTKLRRKIFWGIIFVYLYAFYLSFSYFNGYLQYFHV